MRVVNWTEEAKSTFNSNLNYLHAEWNAKVVSDFLDRVDYVVELIQTNPNSFLLVNSEKNVRRCVVTKQISLYFKIVSKDQIDLITFWNTYQNPEKLKL
jgi:plasmid stabilization system protein ParE